MITWLLQRDGEYEKCDVREVRRSPRPCYVLYVTSSWHASRLESYTDEDQARWRWTALERTLRREGWRSANDPDLQPVR